MPKRQEFLDGVRAGSPNVVAVVVVDDAPFAMGGLLSRRIERRPFRRVDRSAARPADSQRGTARRHGLKKIPTCGDHDASSILEVTRGWVLGGLILSRALLPVVLVRTRCSEVYRPNLDPSTHMLSVGPELLTAYRNAEIEAGVAASTISRRLSTLRSIFGMLVTLGRKEQNPADPKMVRSPRVPREGVTPGIEPHEVRKMLKAPATSKPIGRRDRAILAVGLYI